MAQLNIGTGEDRDLVINPTDSVPEEVIHQNFHTNMAMIDRWVTTPFDRLREDAWIFSGGPSVEKRFEEGFFRPEDFAWRNKDRTVFAVKHALPTLAKWNVVPRGVVHLDPRPLSEKTTHGKWLPDLFLSAPKETTMFIASMSHPSITQFLLDNGYKVVGWHSECKATKANDEKLRGVPRVGLGTCSAMRAIGLVGLFGFPRIFITGYDCGYLERPEDWDDELKKAAFTGQKPKYMEVTDNDNGPFFTTGELVAQAQDLKVLFANRNKLPSYVEPVGMFKWETLGGSVVDAARAQHPSFGNYLQQLIERQ